MSHELWKLPQDYPEIHFTFPKWKKHPSWLFTAEITQIIKWMLNNKFWQSIHIKLVTTNTGINDQAIDISWIARPNPQKTSDILEMHPRPTHIFSDTWLAACLGKLPPNNKLWCTVNVGSGRKAIPAIPSTKIKTYLQHVTSITMPHCSESCLYINCRYIREIRQGTHHKAWATSTTMLGLAWTARMPVSNSILRQGRGYSFRFESKLLCLPCMDLEWIIHNNHNSNNCH